MHQVPRNRFAIEEVWSSRPALPAISVPAPTLPANSIPRLGLGLFLVCLVLFLGRSLVLGLGPTSEVPGPKK